MALVDDDIRAMVRRSVSGKFSDGQRQAFGFAVQFVGALILAAGVVLVSDIYAEYRMAGYMEFHRMMESAGR